MSYRDQRCPVFPEGALWGVSDRCLYVCAHIHKCVQECMNTCDYRCQSAALCEGKTHGLKGCIIKLCPWPFARMRAMMWFNSACI